MPNSACGRLKLLLRIFFLLAFHYFTAGIQQIDIVVSNTTETGDDRTETGKGLDCGPGYYLDDLYDCQPCSPGTMDIPDCHVVDPCRIDPCENSGTCGIIWTPNGLDMDNFTCHCALPYLGSNCEVMDPCSLDPCKNGGMCHNVPNEFKCQCSSLHTGPTCEEMALWLYIVASVVGILLITSVMVGIYRRIKRNSPEADPESETAPIVIAQESHPQQVEDPTTNLEVVNEQARRSTISTVLANHQHSHSSPTASGDLATADPDASPPNPNPNASSSLPAASHAASSQEETLAHSSSNHLPMSDPQLNTQSTQQSQPADQPGNEDMRLPQQGQPDPTSPQDQSASTYNFNHCSIDGLHIGDVNNYYLANNINGPGPDQGPGTEGESRGPFTEETGANLSDRCEGETRQPSSQVPNSMHLGDNAGGNGAIGTAPSPGPTPPSHSSPSQGATAAGPGSESLARADPVGSSHQESQAEATPLLHPPQLIPASSSPQSLRSDFSLYTEQTGPIHSSGPEEMVNGGF